MKKPIYRIFVTFTYKNKSKTGRAKVGTKTVSMISTETTPSGVMGDSMYSSRLYRSINRTPSKVDISITNIEIEGQYGETTDRFPDE